MQNIDVENWEQFEEELKRLQKKRAKSQIAPGPPPSRFLFRGQEDSHWPLTTTLERTGQKGMVFAEYYGLISRVQSEIETFTGLHWNVRELSEIRKSLEEFDSITSNLTPNQEEYGYMVHLRHHGFPSPLLDWTRSEYIAAFFAFKQPKSNKVAIYVYQEKLGPAHASGSYKPFIKHRGRYVRSHRRHFLQQCEYTICVNWQPNEWRFTPHEDVFARNDPTQDVLWKFTIPSTER